MAINTSTKSPTVVLLLCIFLGNFGIHRFYVGKIGTGILMFLTLGGLGIWYLIDLALIVSNRFTDKRGNIIELAKNPPRFKKVMTVFGIIIIVLYGFWISAITSVILATSALVEVADNQLNALRSGDVDKAYSYTSMDFQNNTTPENFRKFVEQYQLESNESASFPSREIAVDKGDIKGRLKLKNGTLLFIEYHFTKENDQWKIQNMQLKSNASDTQKSNP